MDILRPVRVFDKFQQRHKALAIPMAVLKKFADDGAGNLAALVAYYAFFSLVPLLLVFYTILGFVLQGDTSAQQEIENTVTNQFAAVKGAVTVKALHGNVTALVIGIVTSVWFGLGITQAAQNAFDHVWAVPFKDRPDFIHRRLQGLALLVTLGLLFIVATVASGLVTGGHGNGALLKVVGIVFSVLVNVVLFFAAFRFMTARTVPTSSMWIGVVVAAVFWETLQILAGIYIGHLAHASATYASFGFIIALLLYLHLGAQLTLYAAEINVVLERKLYPRSLFGAGSPADQRTLEALAKVEERHDTQRIDVHFLPDEPV